VKLNVEKLIKNKKEVAINTIKVNVIKYLTTQILMRKKATW